MKLYRRKQVLERGASITEYSVLIFLIAIPSIIFLQAAGVNTQLKFYTVVAALRYPTYDVVFVDNSGGGTEEGGPGEPDGCYRVAREGSMKTGTFRGLSVYACPPS